MGDPTAMVMRTTADSKALCGGSAFAKATADEELT